MNVLRELSQLEKDLRSMKVNVTLKATDEGIEVFGHELADRLVAKVEIENRRMKFFRHIKSP